MGLQNYNKLIENAENIRTAVEEASNNAQRIGEAFKEMTVDVEKGLVNLEDKIEKKVDQHSLTDLYSELNELRYQSYSYILQQGGISAGKEIIAANRVRTSEIAVSMGQIIRCIPPEGFMVSAWLKYTGAIWSQQEWDEAYEKEIKITNLEQVRFLLRKQDDSKIDISDLQGLYIVDAATDLKIKTEFIEENFAKIADQVETIDTDIHWVKTDLQNIIYPSYGYVLAQGGISLGGNTSVTNRVNTNEISLSPGQIVRCIPPDGFMVSAWLKYAGVNWSQQEWTDIYEKEILVSNLEQVRFLFRKHDNSDIAPVDLEGLLILDVSSHLKDSVTKINTIELNVNRLSSKVEKNLVEFEQGSIFTHNGRDNYIVNSNRVRSGYFRIYQDVTVTVKAPFLILIYLYDENGKFIRYLEPKQSHKFTAEEGGLCRFAIKHQEEVIISPDTDFGLEFSGLESGELITKESIFPLAYSFYDFHLTDIDYKYGELPAYTTVGKYRLQYTYELYDRLLEDFSEYVEKIECGVDAGIDQPDYMKEYPIYLYKFIPSYVTNSNRSAAIYPANRLKILITTGTHPEYAALMGNFYMMDAICRQWKTSKALEQLRWNVEFYVIPCSGPYGVAHGTRTNYNGVDLNRNMPERWELSDEGDYYSGASPASEYESKLLIHYLDCIKPDIYVDYHNFNINAYGHQMYVSSIGKLAMDAGLETIRRCSREWKNRYEDYLRDDSIMLGYGVHSSGMGTRGEYGNSLGIIALTFESCDRLNWNNGVMETKPNSANNSQIITQAADAITYLILRLADTVAKGKRKMNKYD